ncbi:THO complex subunit 1 transcription elongation factor-domain-containing protein [Kickxella alabastrina]|uniref:THO complex subunit 1 transcription elongation factor-domain-containing protein n=1 Tax=Kickxella alabastrina TaxID=61397 RepID=UPI00221F472B|nr:THO complex subunit 1 transcription elongation factor-domain-containing protein [Kickxella alabastrina]KAI7834413.1 THO complex subunit 1 transcription elongation factor-domain-containing protein [Kickxella alabastrina]
MDDKPSLRELVEKAVAAVIDAQIIYKDDASAVEEIIQITSALRLALESADDTSGQKRDLEYVLHTCVVDATQHIDSEEALVPLLSLLDIAAVLSDKELLLSKTEVVDSSLAFTLLEETMDTVGRRASLLRRGVVATGGKGIVMLKMCNGLLRRIPQADMSEFAGRVQVFVANSFALSERSGVNLRGDTDTRHVARASESVSGDALYSDFWLLQRYFADPQMLKTGDAAAAFIRAATVTVDEFRRTISSRAPPITLDPTGNETLRHLTSPSLLRMQMGDAQVKCQVLLQLLILVRHSATNKALTGGFALTDEEQAALRDLRKRATGQLVGAANDRGLFSRTAQFILFHESCWFRWKAESCKPFEPQPLLPTELIAEMQAAARSFLAHGTVAFAAPTEGAAPLWALPPAVAADVEALGCAEQGITLASAMASLDLYCREDCDYELLTASEQTRADLMQWRALRESVQDNMFRRLDAASHALVAVRESLSESAMLMEVDTAM